MRDRHRRGDLIIDGGVGATVAQPGEDAAHSAFAIIAYFARLPDDGTYRCGERISAVCVAAELIE